MRQDDYIDLEDLKGICLEYINNPDISEEKRKQWENALKSAEELMQMIEKIKA